MEYKTVIQNDITNLHQLITTQYLDTQNIYGYESCKRVRDYEKSIAVIIRLRQYMDSVFKRLETLETLQTTHTESANLDLENDPLLSTYDPNINYDREEEEMDEFFGMARACTERAR